ncbi:DNA polymerase Y family protein [Pseudomonadales bacterium]|nr:DNA polymerase Y family protein [Pseudomonadales bacterium]
MYWLCIYLPALPLEVFEPSKQAVAIIENQQVLLCNDVAAKQGIEPGLTASTSLALSSTIVLINREPEKEQQLIKHLAEQIYQFSSQVVAYKNHNQEQSVLLEIGSSLRLFNGADSLLKKLHTMLYKNPLSETGFQHFFGLAQTIKAAELLARCSKGYSLAQEKTYHGAENKKKHTPPFVQHNHWHDVMQAPVQKLDCQEKIIRQCLDMGFNKIGEILALPTSTLTKRFNLNFINYLDKLQGKTQDPQIWFTPKEYFHREIFSIDGLRSHADLQQPIKKLLTMLCDYLLQRQLKCTDITWIFTRFSKNKNTLEINLSQPQSSYENLLELSKIHLDQLPMDSPVENIFLSSKNFIKKNSRHTDLFSSHEKCGEFSLLADKIKSKLGDMSLWQLKTKESHLPEKSNSMEYFGKQYLNKIKNNEMNIVNDNDYRPAWLLQTPVPLKEKNKCLLFNNNKLHLIKGPERIQCDWWSNRDSRDYFIAGLANKSDYLKKTSSINENPNEQTIINSYENVGCWESFYWIYYDRIKKTWYLQGEFS